ncbi:MAG: bifunctional homocysteine S-methyltransferase/methylenetetrahydrofolate reductase [Verrucomicrobiae bacterium]|nr:bifunctional homocysteine S-methyltransferase/methylenetetrahydrofolate reductase [Verrucomicrobiae bacterium]
MAENLLERMQRGVVLGDGAMGTLLYERGLPLDRCSEELTLTGRDLIRRVHEDYLAAGAHVIETNSFGANRAKLARFGLEGRVNEINWQAARLAREVVGTRDALVAGSVGPLGAALDEVRERGLDPEGVFREQIGALLEGGADFILFETFSDLEELLLALRALKSLSDAASVCSMSFTEEGRTHRGVAIEDAFARLHDAGADAVGANCCIGPRPISDLFSARGGRFGDLPLSAYPNAGRPELLEARFHYPTTPAYFAEKALDLARAGARLIGGCCGTRPEHIAAVRDALRGFIPSPVRAEAVATRAAPTLAPAASAAPAASTLIEIACRRTLIVVEFDPPKTLSLDRMLEAGRALKAAGADFLTVADNSLAVMRMSAPVASYLAWRDTGLRPIVHFACRDRNLIGVQSELMGMDALGLDHVLALTGDPSKVGDTPGATSVYDLNSISLLEGIRAMNGGRSFGGRDLKRATRFTAGCTFNPNARNLDVQVRRLERKLAAGATFVMTQPIFDPALARAARDALARFGIPVLVGVMPLLNHRNAEFLHNEVPGIVLPDSVRERMRGKEGAAGLAEGLAVAREIAAEVLAHFGGIYLVTPLVRHELTAELTQAIRKGTL